jgi:hypothetical protein
VGDVLHQRAGEPDGVRPRSVPSMTSSGLPSGFVSGDAVSDMVPPAVLKQPISTLRSRVAWQPVRADSEHMSGCLLALRHGHSNSSKRCATRRVRAPLGVLPRTADRSILQTWSGWPARERMLLPLGAGVSRLYSFDPEVSTNDRSDGARAGDLARVR